MGSAEKELNYQRNYTVLNINRDMENFSFNTALARMMEYVNALYKYDNIEDEKKNIKFMKECLQTLILLLAPFAPHFSEELWSLTGNKKSVFLSEYPEADETALVKDETEYAVQVNSKMKGKIMVSKDSDEATIIDAAKNEPKVKEAIEGKTVAKVIVISGRLVNIICK